MSLSIIIPAKNEAATIGQVAGTIQGLYPDAELIVVDDGSTDETAALAREAGAKVISHPVSLGNGAAVKAGDPLGPELAAELLASRERVEGTTACPHGRPTSVRIGRDDLERWFLRR